MGSRPLSVYSTLITMYKALVLAAAFASVAFAKVSVKGYEANIKAGDLSCKFGSGDILSACGNCAKSITECATSNPNKTKEVCISHISSFAKDCGGCAVDILECLWNVHCVESLAHACKCVELVGHTVLVMLYDSDQGTRAWDERIFVIRLNSLLGR